MPTRNTPVEANASSRKTITNRHFSEWRIEWRQRLCCACQRACAPRRCVRSPCEAGSELMTTSTSCAHAGEGVAGVAQRLDAIERLELAPQAADQDVDRARVDVLG